jgi:predicted O-methyltransferase YrrM
VTTMYLGGVPDAEQVVTMEGADSVADQAEKAFRDYGYEKIRMVRGDFGERLNQVLQELGQVDLVFVDGNHRKEPVLDYFRKILSVIHNDSCIVFDDIHWSREMEDAWAEICNDNNVRLTIDLHAIGIVFFKKEFLEKQHFTIRY